MKATLRTLSLSALAFVVFCSPSYALGADILKVKGMGVLRGKVASWDPVAEKVTFVTEDGAEHVIKTEDLDRLSAYKLAKTKVDVNSAKDQVKLGNFARSIELFAYAGQHYHAALKLDPSMTEAISKEQATNRRMAAEYCMSHARQAVSKSDLHGAEKWLTTLVKKLPEEPLAAQASSMLSEYYKKNHAAKDDELEEKFTEELSADLKLGKKYYDKMLADNQAGLANSSKSGTAKRHWESAWREGEKALAELDKVQKTRGTDDGNLTELFDGYRKLIDEHMIDSQLHLAAQYSTQTSYNKALEAANKALSIDSKNKQALAARARIEEAVSNGGGFRRWW